MTEEIDEEHPAFPKYLKKGLEGWGEQIRKEHFSKGHPIVYIESGLLVWEYPNGTKISKPLGGKNGKEKEAGKD